MTLIKNFDVAEFEISLAKYLAKYEKEFAKGIKPHTKPFQFIEEFKNLIRNRLNKLHNENYNETTAFLKAQEFRVKLGIKTFGNALEKYYRKIKKPLDINIDGLSQIVGLYTFRDINIPALKKELSNKAAIPEANKVNSSITNIEGKTITVKDESVDIIVNILTNYISKENKDDLLTVLKGNSIPNKILFQSNANKLTDVFWSLTRPNIQIIMNTKTHLEKWIFETFKYLNKNSKPTEFDITDIHKSVSSATRRCKKPLKEIERYLGSIS